MVSSSGSGLAYILLFSLRRAPPFPPPRLLLCPMSDMVVEREIGTSSLTRRAIQTRAANKMMLNAPRCARAPSLPSTTPTMSNASFRDLSIVLIDTSRKLVQAGLGLHDLLKTPSVVRPAVPHPDAR